VCVLVYETTKLRKRKGGWVLFLFFLFWGGGGWGVGLVGGGGGGGGVFVCCGVWGGGGGGGAAPLCVCVCGAELDAIRHECCLARWVCCVVWHPQIKRYHSGDTCACSFKGVRSSYKLETEGRVPCCFAEMLWCRIPRGWNSFFSINQGLDL